MTTQESGSGTQDREFQASQFARLMERFGVGTAEEMTDMVESLETQLNALYRNLDADADGGAAGGEASGDETLESLDLQLQSLYREKDRLYEAIGAAEAEDIISMVQSMDVQLQNLYAEREDYTIIDGESIVIRGPRKIYIKKSRA